MNIYKKLIYLCATVLTAMLSVGCSQSDNGDNPDDPGFEEGIPTEVRITLYARSCNGTRAADSPQPDGTPKDPVSSIELMHNWWIVFVDQKGNVKVIEDSDIPLADKIRSTPSFVASPEEGFEAETFKTILPSGTYRIYAFANIEPKSETDFKSYLKQDKNGKWVHKTLHLIDFIEDGKISKDGMQWPDTENIPMTGVMTNKIIKNTVEEAFNVEVIRAVAKVEFAFSSSTTETITLKKLEFSPISKYEKISFVPNNDSVGFGPNDKLIKDKVETGALSFVLNSTLTTANPYTLGFYCNESLPHDKDKYNNNQKEYESKPLTDLYTQHFTINLTYEKNGVLQPEKTLYTKKITYINRNDWIKIPIEFSDWKIYWKLQAYPPIGGYPPVFEQDEEGKTLSATVTTGGEFELYPFKIAKGSSSDNYADRIDWDKVDVKVESGSDLFIKDKEPKLVPDPNNATAKIIVGELDPKKNETASAKVRIDFYLKESTNITSRFTCTFTIKRQNSAPSSGTGDDSSDD